MPTYRIYSSPDSPFFQRVKATCPSEAGYKWLVINNKASGSRIKVESDTESVLYEVSLCPELMLIESNTLPQESIDDAESFPPPDSSTLHCSPTSTGNWWLWNRRFNSWGYHNVKNVNHYSGDLKIWVQSDTVPSFTPAHA